MGTGTLASPPRAQSKGPGGAKVRQPFGSRQRAPNRPSPARFRESTASSGCGKTPAHAGFGKDPTSVGRQTVENCVRALAPEVSFLRPRRLLPQPLQPCRQAAEATQAPQGEDFERRHASALRLESATSIQAPQGPKLSVENPPLNPLGQTSAVASPAAASQPRSNPLTFFPTHPTSTEDSKWLGILGVALGG